MSPDWVSIQTELLQFCSNYRRFSYWLVYLSSFRDVVQESCEHEARFHSEMKSATGRTKTEQRMRVFSRVSRASSILKPNFACKHKLKASFNPDRKLNPDSCKLLLKNILDFLLKCTEYHKYVKFLMAHMCTLEYLPLDVLKFRRINFWWVTEVVDK
jgi:hypothetical protein